MPAQKKYDLETQVRTVRMFPDRMAAAKSRRMPPFSGVLVLVASRSLRLVDPFSHTRWVAGHYAV